MIGRSCPACGALYRVGDRYCGRCGARRSMGAEVVPTGARFSSLRLQVDPISPPPRRDLRYVLIVAGMACAILAVLLYVVSAVVTFASSGTGASCGSPPCPGADIAVWFLGSSVAVLVLGLALLGGGLWWTFRPATRLT